MKLSICIPTYNREKFLKELLDSIIIQIDNRNKINIEICISDNNSIDGTEKLIKEYIKKNKVKIRYHKNPKNMGADFNYLKCVEIATGEYCWLIGSDDILIENSINKVLFQINNFLDISVFLWNRIDCDYNMKIIKKRYWSKINEETTINFLNTEEVINYFKSVLSLGGVFSYLSTIIFKKEEWDQIEYDTSYNGTCYSFVYILFSILIKGKKMKYLIEFIVLCRGENDSFIENSNFKKRCFIDFQGYYRFSDLLTNERERKTFLEILSREHSIKVLLSLGKDYKFSLVEKKLLLNFGYNKFVINFLLDFIYYNRFFFKFIHKGYKKIKRIKG